MTPGGEDTNETVSLSLFVCVVTTGESDGIACKKELSPPALGLQGSPQLWGQQKRGCLKKLVLLFHVHGTAKWRDMWHEHSSASSCCRPTGSPTNIYSLQKVVIFSHS
jgi:hypothetical protein